jgi:phosphoenolpyruvate carboxykinase (GTP)
MAEHMLILGLESPEGKKIYVAAAFPSACGKTNFSMLRPPPGFEGWKVTTLGDDIAWLQPRADGRLYAINPEAGYFGVLPGTGHHSNPIAMEIIRRDTIYTNVGLTPDLDVWWEGKDEPAPAGLLDWKGNPWSTGSKAAHPNSRFTASMRNNPNLAPEVDEPSGVPISAIIFGGRRSDTMPLVFQACDWAHGVYLGSTMASETTAAAANKQGELRRDPMAMLPFCGYHLGDYLQHWLNIGQQLQVPPLIFHVNWFRKDSSGNYLWPGFSRNMHVLKWIYNRCEGSAPGTLTPLGWMPRFDNFASAVSHEDWKHLNRIDPADWEAELAAQDSFLRKLSPRLPCKLLWQREMLEARIRSNGRKFSAADFTVPHPEIAFRDQRVT